MQQEVGGADGERDLVPLAVGEAVGEGLGARLAFEAVVVADLLSHPAALQLKVTAGEEDERGSVFESKEKYRLKENTLRVRSSLAEMCKLCYRVEIKTFYIFDAEFAGQLLDRRLEYQYICS